MRDKEESGFFSYESSTAPTSFRVTANIREISEEPRDFDDDLPDPSYAQCFDLTDKEYVDSQDDSDNHVTIISVDYIDREGQQTCPVSVLELHLYGSIISYNLVMTGLSATRLQLQDFKTRSLTFGSTA